MQAVRYFVAFRVCKAAESIFGAVTCCSGCFSAYRREAIAPVLERWENQRFLGRPATYGDDRSLTNFVLRNWDVRYDELARSRTIVPDHFQRLPAPAAALEALLDARVADRGPLHLAQAPRSPACGPTSGSILPLVAPLVAVRAIAWQPLVGGCRRAVRLPDRHLRDGARVRPLLRAAARPLRHAVDVRRAVRLLLPRVPAVADVLRDPHLAQLELGHARRPRPRSAK